MAETNRTAQTACDSLGCPFMDAGDARCARHFSLGRLSEAFSLCLNGYHTCETYYQLRTEHGVNDEPIKIQPGAEPRDARRLRRTGT